MTRVRVQTFEDDGTTGQVFIRDTASPNGGAWGSGGGGSPSSLKRTIGCVVDGGGSAITTGLKSLVRVPFDGTITGWTVMSDVVGSVVVDVWKDSFAASPPTVADSIAGTEKPTLSSAQKAEDTTLTTWTTAITAGDVLAFNVDSASTVTRVIVQLEVTVA